MKECWIMCIKRKKFQINLLWCLHKGADLIVQCVLGSQQLTSFYNIEMWQQHESADLETQICCLEGTVFKVQRLKGQAPLWTNLQKPAEGGGGGGGVLGTFTLYSIRAL